MSIESRINEAVASLDVSGSEHAKLFINTALENRNEADKKYVRSFYLFVIFAILYHFIRSGAVQEISFFSVKLSSLNLILWLSPAAMSFMIYVGASNLIIENYLRMLMHAYWKTYLPKIYSSDLENLADYPSFVNFERLSAQSGTGSGLASNFGFAIIAVMIVGSHGIVVYIIFDLWNYAQTIGWALAGC